MPLEPRTIVDHYEILSLLGAGGMGQVYCARDARLGRKVAVKMLLPSFAEDQERLSRFRHEMQTLALLSHPNILEIFDTGSYDGAPYLVMECLEGETLRQRLEKGPLPTRKAVDAARQIALGLAAAHEKGIIHRDLKPENLFILGDDRIKILDFGLAKQHHDLLPSDQTPGMGLGQSASLTKTGLVLGTLVYLSPEQVSGGPADTRSDIFTFGVVLWEMLYGVRPFRRDSMVETMHSILKEDPELPSKPVNLPQGLEMILLRCLEKDPRRRFQTAQDLAFALAALGDVSRPSVSLLKHYRRPRGPLPWRLIGAAAGLVLVTAGLVWAGLGLAKKTQVRLRRLTYQDGLILNARLAPDQVTYLYSVSFQGASPEVWMGRLDGVDLQRLDLPKGTRILAISPSGELATLLGCQEDQPGTLARVAMTGGTPERILDQVWNADWSPDGKALAVVRSGEKGRQRLEFPAGNLLFESPPGARIPFLRVSPRGDQVAFTCGGAAYVVSRMAKVRQLARTPGTWDSLVWSKDGKQLFLSALPDGDRQEIWAVDMAGHLRLVYSSIGRLRVQDVTPKGQILAAHIAERAGIQARMSGEEGERDLSCLHSSGAVDLSTDGRSLLLSETREGDGPGGAYLRRAEDPGAIRLGSGRPFALSPDGQWALVQSVSSENNLLLLPTGAGKVREIYTHDVLPEWGQFLQDGKRILVGGSAAGRPFAFYFLGIDSAELERLPWEAGPGALAILSPDDSMVATGPLDGKLQVINRKDGKTRTYPVAGDARLLRWSQDGTSIFLASHMAWPARILRLELASGRQSPWKELAPPAIRGLTGISRVTVTPDGKAYAYSYRQILTSDLYLLEGYRQK